MQPPPFQPPADEIAALAAEISSAASKYGASQDASALEVMTKASKRLALTTTSPGDRVLEFCFQPHPNMAAYMAVEIDLFKNLPEAPQESISVDELAKKCNAEAHLVRRVARALACVDILEETANGSYAHTLMSRMLATKGVGAVCTHLTEDVVRSLSFMGDFFAKYGRRAPFDPRNAPVALADGVTDMNAFDIFQTKPKSWDTFNDAMGFAAPMTFAEVIQSYPFDALLAGQSDDEIALVDVGGGKGHDLAGLVERYPKLRGHVVLEDLEGVLKGGTIAKEPDVKLVEYDFFKDAQPIKGAKAYLFKMILHDWPDDDCKNILRQMKPALRGYDSRILINDIVIEESHPNPHKCLRDINMFVTAGMERTLKEWEELLSGEGFTIVKVHGSDRFLTSIIEAVLSES